MSEIEHVDKTGHYSILDLIQDEVNAVKSKIPKDFDSIAKFFAITRPIIEVILMNCGDWSDQFEPVGRGKKPISHASLMLIHVLSKMKTVSYRQIERELNERPTWLKALKLAKAPSHSKLSTFRTEMGDSFFKDFFSNLTDFLHRLDLIKGESVTIDSAPITASMNFARANTTPEINVERVREFFTNIDLSLAIHALNISHKRKYSPESIICFFMFEKLGNFLSTSQALKFLEKHTKIAEILGFVNGQIPSQPTFNYFIKTHGSVPDLLKPLVEGVTEFFENCVDTPEDSDIDFFFWSF
jgi:hypothetical protein